MSRTIFITGTDTGVGKTLLTALLLEHLRQGGTHALAIKPFSSGGTGDADLLQKIQRGELSAKEVNTFHFAAPVAPLVGAREEGRRIELGEVAETIQSLSLRTECLLVEGAGGLLAPLGEQFSLADIVARLGGEVMVVGPNQLGILNHMLLTVEAMRARRLEGIRVILMEQAKPDVSARSNGATLRGLLAPVEVFSLPFLGPRATRYKWVKENTKKIKKTLARILDSVSVSPRSLERLPKRWPRQDG